MDSSSSTGLRDARLGTVVTPEKFWDFVTARQEIWHQRFPLDQPPPWTDDPILQRFFFCNVYRELDKGTQWYLKNIPGQEPFDFVDVLFRTIVYRLVNSVAIFEKVGVGGLKDWPEMIQLMRDQGLKLHSPAYLTLGAPNDLHNHVDRLEFILKHLSKQFSLLTAAVFKDSRSLQDVSGVLQNEYGIGPFVAMQVYRDLILVKVLDYDEDSYTDIGPGAAPVLKALTGSNLRKHWYRMLEWLREREVRELGKRGFHFYQDKPLSLCDLQQSACEYRKYTMLSLGMGRRRYYHGGV